MSLTRPELCPASNSPSSRFPSKIPARLPFLSKQLLEFFFCGTAPLGFERLHGKRGLDHPDGSEFLQRQHGIPIPRVDDRFLVVLVGGGLHGHGKAGAHLNTIGTKREGCSHAASVRNTSRGDHGNVDRIDDLRHQGKRGDLVDAVVPSGFKPLGDHGVTSGSRRLCGHVSRRRSHARRCIPAFFSCSVYFIG